MDARNQINELANALRKALAREAELKTATAELKTEVQELKTEVEELKEEVHDWEVGARWIEEESEDEEEDDEGIAPPRYDTLPPNYSE